ncbi:putative Uncharacterized KamA family protein [Glarea lozoyensis 74030]|uniref:Putative Uncharacterized KamA family protein n=1 Tax=Glarea lozoyensis (strain ATCC 74030 / MF5533) TaxID=1104152 RepID=H0EVC4_GLAL7|nr:putative Uncharacterized KamA family protein [Glarea lozoyensis 74030]
MNTFQRLSHLQMYLLLRSKNVKASNVIHRAYLASHGYHTTRTASSNLAIAYKQENDQYSDEDIHEEETRKPARPISRFDKPLGQLKDFHPNPEKLTRKPAAPISRFDKQPPGQFMDLYSNPDKVRLPRKAFAGSKTMPFIMHVKSDIRVLLEQNAPYLDWRPYHAAAEVFAPRQNNYVLNNHINWNNLPYDPYFKLTFPQPEMLRPEMLHLLLDKKMSRMEKQVAVKAYQEGLNAHPAGQQTMNVPMMDGRKLEGIQHKYRETMLFFPAERHKDITDLLITGGDAMVAKAEALSKYIDPLLNNPETEHLQTIRFGTKSLAFWPYKFTEDDDAVPMLELFKKIKASRKCVSIQAHFTHPIELKTKVVQEAIANIQATGAIIRTQSPIVRGINDSTECWTEMLNLQTRLGLAPYYMFMERDTGAKEYFQVPIQRALDIFHKTVKAVPGTAKTIRGPVMSAGPGKIHILGTSEVGSEKEKVFVLRFVQARNPDWCDADKVFYAEYDPEACWLSDLKPASGEKEWFWEAEYREMEKNNDGGSSGQRLQSQK